MRTTERTTIIATLPAGRRKGLHTFAITATLSDDGRFSAVGYKTDGRRIRPDWEYGGQCQDIMRDELRHVALQIPRTQFHAMLRLWERWHLNDMRAGCEHQRVLWDENVKLPDGRYAVHVRPNEHPDGLLMKRCPTCGYAYGSQWLTETIPPDALAEIRDVFGLRDSATVAPVAGPLAPSDPPTANTYPED